MFDLIAADCPWHYNARAASGTKFGGGSSAKYEQIKTDRLCTLAVDSISTSQCILFQWVTWPKLKDGIRVMEAWGFRYTTIGFIWVKIDKSGKSLAGPGCYTASNS